VIAAGAISLALGLGVERRLAVAAVRTVVQLGLLGLVLERIFAVRDPLLVVALLLLMTVFAAREAIGRASRRYRGVLLDAWLTMAATCFIVGGVVTQVVVGVTPWYDPQYVIPLLGMILGNSLTGISLCLDRFLDHLAVRTAEVELRIAYGATRREALAAPLQDAVRTGMIPIINAMAAAGIVSLPGMMTGQILAGSPPLQAVAYQLVVMFMIAAAVAFGAMMVDVLAGRHFMGKDATLRLDRLKVGKS
ncbi:MAG TPA: iron export ABC transporter permease subunit FetB, partial [Candidatus Sulfomarinibacteraceae bacterium]|nr:iron export ABC transporter permease subunit FetB [Candidatus Sulfomarinibacteraceae bacterium]